MKAIQYLIDKTGALIQPTTISFSNIDLESNHPTGNQITCIFYDAISTSSTGVITPINPVTTGMTGTINIQARSNDDSAWSNIQNGLLDLSTGENMVFPSGVIRSINAICTSITGCNYILIRLDRGV